MSAPNGRLAKDEEQRLANICQNLKKKMVGETGFEPATLCSQNRCATRLRHSPTVPEGEASHATVKSKKQAVFVVKLRFFEDGGPGGTRTPDLAVMSGQL